ncbi:MAG: MFS transporter [Bacteroidetes bacterium RBG_19FT_COMBO_42_7]|nr:MAG: MFS transporter [Bacteroidetes bacterium RBG_13_42_15]OFY78434.1 MAG: MFS transporter [Bacteroidetes bacterium RBG_19FT_COMBO_42_7]
MDFSSKLKTIFRSLQYRNYRLFFGGQSISLIGTWMQRIAMPWLVYHLTGSAFLLGLVSFAGQIPTFLLAPLAGVVTDKFSRYRVLLITQVISLLQALILALLSLAGVIQIWHIVVLSIALGCVNAFDVPSRHSFVIEMVEKKEHLGNAIALNSMMFNGARLIGPSIAGLILATAGEGICFLINAVSYIFVVMSLLSMKIQKKEITRKSGNLLNDMKEGFRYTFGFVPIKHLLILLGIVSLMGSSYQVLMPVFAKEILHGNSSTFGFLMGAAGVGALAGAIFLASRETLIKLGRIIPAASAMFGAGLVALSFTKYFPVSLLLMIIIGLGLMLQTASSNTILQTITDDDKRGRVMSFYTIAIMGTAPFGSLLAGSLAKVIGTPYTILIGGISCIAGAFLFYKKLPELKKIVHPVYVKMGLIPEIVTGIQTASEPVVESVQLPVSGPVEGNVK